MTHNKEQQEQFDRLSHLRGFEPLDGTKLITPRVRLRRADEVWYEGKAYRVIDVMGSPKLEPIVKTK